MNRKLFLALGWCLLGVASAPAGTVFTEWTSVTPYPGIPPFGDGPGSAAGTLNGAPVTFSANDFSVNSPSLLPANLSGPNFAAAPGGPAQSALSYNVGADWTATFDTPQQDLLLYAVFWRGPAAGGGPVTYTFDQPFTVRSGFGASTVSGNSVTVPAAAFQSGILQFSGSVSSLSVTSSSPLPGQQQITFGVDTPAAIPEPSSLALLAGAAVGLVLVRRRKALRRSGSPA